MVTRSFKPVLIPTLIEKSVTTGKVSPITSSDLNKTHFVINQLQTNTAQAFKPLLQNPIATNAITLKNVTLIAGQPNTINHMLGQTLQGWTFSRPQSFCALWEDANQSNLATQLVLWTYIDTITDIVVW